MATGSINSLPEPLRAQIQSVAEEEHRSPDEVLADAVKFYIEQRSWTKLLEDGQAHARTLGINESDVDRLIAEYRSDKRRP